MLVIKSCHVSNDNFNLTVTFLAYNLRFSYVRFRQSKKNLNSSTSNEPGQNGLVLIKTFVPNASGP